VTPPLTLDPGQNVTLTVIFAPAATGSVSGSVSVVSSADNSPTTIALSGSGVSATAHSVTLNWTASVSAVAGYNVYRASVSGGPYTQLNSSLISGTSFTDANVQPGQSYFYVTSAVDASTDESAFSNEVSATIPSP
jgi:fibronectin type 3 domain-containing protein